MKLTAFLLCINFFAAIGSTYSQHTKFTLSGKDVQLEDVLNEIKKKSEFRFFYNHKLVDLKQRVEYEVEDATVSELLDQVLNEAGIKYEIVDKTIILSPKEQEKPAVQPQKKTIKGKVSDEKGIPLPGVSIIVKGTTIGIISDADGNYDLEVPEDAQILVFSFVGMKTMEVAISGKDQIDISLIEEALGIEEVVAIGYGIKKKSDVISSVVAVSPESVNKVPSTDIGEMLKGKAAGVYITLNDAGPGSSSDILIRGKNSINGGNNPIVIVDGVPVGDINDVNPNDISSLEILKDAAAQAIYGARASNGVILVTTKRADVGKAIVNYSGYYGAQTVKRNFDVYSGEEYAQLKREAYRADNNGYLPDSEIFTALEMKALESGEFIDWEEELLRIAPMQNHNLSVASGKENTRMYTSLSYLNQDGVVPGTDYQKMTFRINADQKVNDWLSLGVNTSWQISKNNDPGTGGTLNRSITTSPLGQIYDEDGNFMIYPTGVQESLNPLLDLATTKNIKNDSKDIVNVFIDIEPFKGFKYRINASRRSWNRKVHNYSTAESLIGFRRGGLGQGSISFEDSKEWQLENIFTYDLEKKAHKFDFTFVQSISEYEYTYYNNAATNLPNDLLGIYGLEAAETNTPSISANERGLLSFVGRVQYNYNGKYYATISARADASTVFGANNKWGYFPAVALGWNIYREKFVETIPSISNLKLRLSYGSVGNEAISPYQSQSTATQRDYIFNGIKRSGYVPGTYLPNPDLKWETSTTLNTAIDFGLWKNRLSGTVEFYNTRTKNLLIDQSLNAGLGYTKMKTNLGEIENMGVEFTVNGVIVDKNELTISTGFSFSKNNNKIISLYGKDEDGDGVEDDDVGNRWFIGQPIDVYYQYMPVGIFQIGEDIASTHQPEAVPGDIKLYDRYPDDGELNADDRVITKSDPDWFGTFNFDLKYKNFDFSADLMTVQGRIRYNPYNGEYDYGAHMRGILNGIKHDYWLPENPTGNWPRPKESNSRDWLWTMCLEDASFVRLQNVTVGYSLPQKIISRLKLSNVRFYCTGHNLITVTDYQSYSPEKNAGDYPEAISIVGGLQVTF